MDQYKSLSTSWCIESNEDEKSLCTNFKASSWCSTAQVPNLLLWLGLWLVSGWHDSDSSGSGSSGRPGISSSTAMVNSVMRLLSHSTKSSASIMSASSPAESHSTNTETSVFCSKLSHVMIEFMGVIEVMDSWGISLLRTTMDGLNDRASLRPQAASLANIESLTGKKDRTNLRGGSSWS